jgi:quercetin dioxygenase-like cupin family protein
MDKVKSTLSVFHERDVPATQGVAAGLTVRRVVGSAEHPTERLILNRATLKAGTHEKLHWHLIEVCYYVISGRAVITDVEGHKHAVSAGSVIYARPGIAGAHGWDVSEDIELLGIRPTADPERTIQFDVDPETGDSSISFDRLKDRGAVDLKKSMY